MHAVLFDMDGTLVDTEKLWDVGLQELYRRHGGELSPTIRDATVGGSAEGVMRIVYADLGLPADPAEMATTAEWLHGYTAELFDQGVPWCAGARELLDALAEAAVPMALVTNTPRALTERALKTIGGQYFSASVCGDEVRHNKPHPEPYEQAAAFLGLEPVQCLAVEDSVTGTAAAEDAGCPVLVVPNDIAVPMSPRRRHVSSLVEVGIPELREIYAELQHGVGERSA